MGSSQEQRLLTHDRIVNHAATRFRELGPQGLSIADLMKEAGLTHGGFYKHFSSREDLVVQAVTAALEQGMLKGEADPERDLATVVAAYLSKRHRDNPGAGCAMGALLGDVSRAGEETKNVYTEFVRRQFAKLARLVNQARGRKAQDDAIVILSTLLGALGLARAVSDEKLSAAILNTVKKHLIDTYAGPSD